jgi:hypothetical protein
MDRSQPKHALRVALIWVSCTHVFNAALTLQGTASCAVSAVSDGDCYYSPGTTQLYGGGYPVTLPGLTCEQARSMYPPAQGTSESYEASRRKLTM